jgi:hypothetical protein
MNTLLLRIHVRCTNALHRALSPAPGPATDHDESAAAMPVVRDRGQATTEYALVMLGAAAIAVLIIAWATAGGGAGKIGRLFDRVIDAVLDKV